MLHLLHFHKNRLARADFIGVFASGLCLVNCLATPIVFIAKSCSQTCCNETPIWWKTIDFVFLFISLIAVFESSRKSSKNYMKVILWFTWALLSFVILNEYFEFLELFEQAIYIPAILLIGSHLYNLKYCQCETKCC